MSLQVEKPQTDVLFTTAQASVIQKVAALSARTLGDHREVSLLGMMGNRPCGLCIVPSNRNSRGVFLPHYQATLMHSTQVCHLPSSLSI